MKLLYQMQITRGLRIEFLQFASYFSPSLSFFQMRTQEEDSIFPQTYNSHNYWQIDWATIAIFHLQHNAYRWY